jgi:hypothetical protein
MSGSDPHDEIERAAAIRKTLSSFKIPFMAETNSSRGGSIQAELERKLTPGAMI